MYYVTPGYLPIQSVAEDEVDEDYDEVVATNAVETIVEPIQMAAEDEDREEVVATNGVESVVEPIQGGDEDDEDYEEVVVTLGVESIVEHDEKPKRCLVM